MTTILVGTSAGLYRIPSGRSSSTSSRSRPGRRATCWSRGSGCRRGPSHRTSTSRCPTPPACCGPGRAAGGHPRGAPGAGRRRRRGQPAGRPRSTRSPGRDAWYQPHGGPPAVRTMAVDDEGRIYVNVHVGGIVRSDDEGRSWEPTIDIDVDVHQVVTVPGQPGRVVAATARGLATSDDYGRSLEDPGRRPPRRLRPGGGGERRHDLPVGVGGPGGREGAPSTAAPSPGPAGSASAAAACPSCSPATSTPAASPPPADGRRRRARRPHPPLHRLRPQVAPTHHRPPPHHPGPTHPRRLTGGRLPTWVRRWRPRRRAWPGWERPA